MQGADWATPEIREGGSRKVGRIGREREEEGGSRGRECGWEEIK